ncbi:MAG TPA: magnesium transporter CorA [Candidatus Scatomonas merdavium]|nr:magnesium transporter CorA [Candidatus Scatomonas merdavium]
MADCVIGTLLLPDKQDVRLDTFSLTYYLDRNRLLLIDREEHLPALISMGKQAGFPECQDVFQIFFSLLEHLIQGDMVLLQNYEKRLSTMEDAIETAFPKELQRSITSGRRGLLRLLSFYQQLVDMCVILSENGSDLFPPEYRQHFSRLQARADRLYDHTQILREYALQIRELYQSQMDLKQNDTMRLLTVVTTIFLPLTLLTGWYGMNFTHMPELAHPFSYFILIAICLLIIGGEIWFFRKKGWL